MTQTAEEGLRISEEIKKEKTTCGRYERVLQKERKNQTWLCVLDREILKPSGKNFDYPELGEASFWIAMFFPSGFKTSLSTTHNHLRIVSGGNGAMVCEMLVEDSDRNSHGTLHGGMVGLLSDAISTWAFQTKEQTRVSVSTDLHVTYMKPDRVGRIIVIDAKTVKSGQRMVFLSVTIRDKEQGFLIAQAQHTKLILEKGSKL